MVRKVPMSSDCALGVAPAGPQTLTAPCPRVGRGRNLRRAGKIVIQTRDPQGCTGSSERHGQARRASR